MRRAINPPPPWTIFCDEEEGQPKNVQDLLDNVVYGINSVLSLGQIQKPKNYSCQTDDHSLGLRMAVYTQNEFIHAKENIVRLPLSRHKVKYVPVGQENYLKSPKLADRVRNRLFEQGLHLPKNWQIVDSQTFYSVFRKKADKITRNAWHKTTHDLFGEVIPAGLSMDAFTRLKLIQKEIKKDMGEDYVSGLVFSWSEKQFAEQVIHPRIEKIINKELEVFKSKTPDYEDGGRSEKEGKELLRAAIVPPIAVALSLLFLPKDPGVFFFYVRKSVYFQQNN